MSKESKAFGLDENNPLISVFAASIKTVRQKNHKTS
jgi:hypothetical protein